MNGTCVWKHFTVWEVAADWRELVIPQRIMQASVDHVSEQLDPWCSRQTYHLPNQPHHSIPLWVGG